MIYVSYKTAVDLAMSMYIGETCRYCGHEYTSLEDIDTCDVVWAHHKGIDAPLNGSKGQCLACQSCYKRDGWRR